jgi:hypothetical protein
MLKTALIWQSFVWRIFNPKICTWILVSLETSHFFGNLARAQAWLGRVIDTEGKRLALVRTRFIRARPITNCDCECDAQGCQAFRDGIRQIVIKTLPGFRYLCQQLAYLVLSRIFLIASQIDESLDEYSAKSVGKQGGEFLMAALEKKS